MSLGFVLVNGLLGCSPSKSDENPPPVEPTPTSDPSDVVDPGPDPTSPCDAPETPAELPEGTLWFQITLDDQKEEGIRVQQGGEDTFVLTDCQGNAVVKVRTRTRALGPTIIASHPDARIRAYEFETPPPNQGPFKIELSRFSTVDNQRYSFQHPGTPSDRANTSRCGHCHEDINDAWYTSSHRTSASNPRVLDHYRGTNSELASVEACESAGGRWLSLIHI